MHEKIRVVLVDDHPMYRESLARVVDSQPDMRTVGQGGTAQEAIRLARELAPNVIVLDLNMPGGGLAAASDISRSCPRVRIAIHTVSEDEDDVIAAFNVGALAYVVKGAAIEELTSVLRSTHEGECYVTPRLVARIW